MVTMNSGEVLIGTRRQRPDDSTRSAISAPQEAILAPNQVFSLSPDGSKLAFFAVCTDGIARLWIHNLDTSEARVLWGSESPFFSPFFWSPDSRFIVFDAGGKLNIIEHSSGSVRTLCSLGGNAVGGSWNHGRIIFGQDPARGLMIVSPDGGAPSQLTIVDSSRGEIRHVLPSLLPGGEHFIYLCVCLKPADSGIYLGSILTDNVRQRSTRLLATEFGATCVATPDADFCPLLFVSNGTLMAQLFDTKRMKLIGKPKALVQQVGLVRDFALFSASQNGVLAYKENGNEYSRLVWHDRTGRSVEETGETALYLMLSLSPNERRIAVARIGDEGGIWIIDRSTGRSTKLITKTGISVYPTWSASGDALIFSSNRMGNFNLYKRRLDRLEDEELLISSEDKFPSDCSQDGTLLLYTALGAGTKYELHLLSLQDGQTKVFLQADFNLCHGRFSPCGNWVAYMSDESGRYEIYVQQFSPRNLSSRDNCARQQISQGGGIGPRWRRDGKQLYYLTPERKVVAVDIITYPVFRKEAETVLFQAPPQTVGITSQWAVDCKGQDFLFFAPAECGNKNQHRFHILPNSICMKDPVANAIS
jgi:Tol biopolymer transport system component